MKHNESKIQIEIVKYIRYLYPKSILFSVPNGHKRNIITASYLKREGLLHGVSDLIWINEGKTYFFEVKTDKGTQSVYQKVFQAAIEKQHLRYAILRSTKDFDNFLKLI